MQKVIADIKKIRYDWGTLKRYARERGINYYTFRNVIYGVGKSKRVENILKEDGYLKVVI